MLNVDMQDVPRSARELAGLAKRKNWGWDVRIKQLKHDECLLVSLTRFAHPQVTIQVRWHRDFDGDDWSPSTKVLREGTGPWSDFGSIELAKELIRRNPDVCGSLSGV